jgi:Ca2+-binding RTX toxin-like protein
MRRGRIIIVAGVLAAALLGPTPVAAGAPSHVGDYCPKRWAAIVYGTSGADTYQTVSVGGKISCYFGLGGADRITGRHTWESIIGGAGADVIHGLGGSNGGDSIDAQGGNDTVYAGDGGPAETFGGAGSDTLVGGTGEQDMFGGPVCTETSYWGFSFNASSDACSIDGADNLSGAGGDDWLWESNSDNRADGSPDVLDGGPGNDYCAVGPEDVATNCETVAVLSAH